jgi:hypothetical protein
MKLLAFAGSFAPFRDHFNFVSSGQAIEFKQVNIRQIRNWITSFLFKQSRASCQMYTPILLKDAFLIVA